jgi:hypothetical protein
MGLRACGVWAVANDPLRRIRERVRCGHVKHVCIRSREFGQEHEGDHRCSCGTTYPKGPTDND